MGSGIGVLSNSIDCKKRLIADGGPLMETLEDATALMYTCIAGKLEYPYVPVKPCERKI